jgi:acyl-CoA synthetase (AMP-forming)/AMP-acid ligase II
LFLTDRKAFTIISGGVNIYPQEIENVLALHPAVYPAYPQATKPASVPLYQHFGFAPAATPATPDGAPVITTMWRPPRLGRWPPKKSTPEKSTPNWGYAHSPRADLRLYHHGHEPIVWRS